MNDFGLQERYLNYIINSVKFFPTIEKAVIFGSRAMGNYKPGSDIDLAIFGTNISRQDLMDLRGILSQGLPIPYFFDVLHFEKTENTALKNHILEQGKTIYENAQPLVSVLMTVYNREKFIAEAIESVINSSYQNWELIIVDDRSTDQSVEIARRYEAADSRIKVYVNEKNLGDYPNRNKAAGYAKGKYIKFLDSDDLMYWYGLQVMVEAMEKYPEAIIGMSSANFSTKQQYSVLLSPQEAYLYHFFYRGFLYTGPTGAIYRTDYFIISQGFNVDYAVAADFGFNLKAALTAPIVLFQTDLFWWRQHEDQEIKKHEKKYLALNHQIHREFVFENPTISPAYRKIIRRNYQTNYARKFFIAIFSLKIRQAFYIKNVAKLSYSDFFWSIFPGKIRTL